jgi:metallophosphoesterase superfamily enzyme
MKEYSLRQNIVCFDQRVLVISDLHLPWQHPDAIHFLAEIKAKCKPEIIVNVGDEVDCHGISFHKSDTSLLNPDKELERAIEEIKKLNELFPKMYLCESNHGSLSYRRLKSEGIPIRNLKTLQDLYETPLWEWHHEITLETHAGKVLVVHGKSGGQYKLAMEQGISCIQGHFHCSASINWFTSTTSMRFNMFVGCLVDEKSMAFAYGKNIARKPILSVGFLTEYGEPCLLRMVTDHHGRWIGKLV